MASGVDPVQVVVLTLVAATAMVLGFRQLLGSVHALQQDDYSNRRFLGWVRKSKGQFPGPAVAACLVAAFAERTLALSGVDWLAYIAPILAAGAAVAFTLWRLERTPSKKPLVYTGRVRRLLVASVMLEALLFAAVYFAQTRWGEVTGAVPGSYSSGLGVTVAAMISIFAAPAVAIAANLVLGPVQATINYSYRVRAARKLRRLGPMVVGITGSYGKTSTKYFTEALLEPRFRVLKTRASFNTILGVCRAINEELGPEHQVLIVEMGAYRRGEIRDMARLTRPHIGVLTAIGPQHLERFGSIETIEKAKFELLESLAPDDIAVINNDDPRVHRLAGENWLPNVQRYGIDAPAGTLDLAAEEISHGPEGLSFTLVERNGTRTPVKTRLIGLHNVSNILAAATVAKSAGVSPQEMARAIGRLQPVPHRLEARTGPDGVTIIDDAYNSNPVGAFNALDALAAFKTGRKLLVTPGMVELGAEQDEWNEKFGAKAADVCDSVILVGTRQTAAIRRGLDGAGFAADRVNSVRNLDDALEALKGIVRAGDVVLFENDLPDLYEE
jgi:UDP-N-acetylmuramoyl-tripeptide--D-alanyl-D-alanine ligase